MLGKLKIQAAITKSVNQKNEDVMRSRAISTKQILSKAQLAVKEHHEKKSTAETMTVEWKICCHEDPIKKIELKWNQQIPNKILFW